MGLPDKGTYGVIVLCHLRCDSKEFIDEGLVGVEAEVSHPDLSSLVATAANLLRPDFITFKHARCERCGCPL